jgi:hypothetical protein
MPWYACDEPERPTDPYVLWHYDDCEACLIKARAVSIMHPGYTAGLIHRMETGQWGLVARQ